jgi:transcriptional regulator with XRE-family HTH domain
MVECHSLRITQITVKRFCNTRIAGTAEDRPNFHAMNIDEHLGAMIRGLRKQRGWTLEKLAADIDTDSGNLSRIERGLQSAPTATLARLAKAFGVSTARLFSTELHADESKQVYEVERPVFPVPVVGTAQPDAEGIFELSYPGQRDGQVLYGTRDTNAYALRVKGDGLRPRIKPREFVIIEPSAQISTGDEVLIKMKDGSSMLKVLHSRRSGSMELLSINEDRKPMTVDEEKLEFIYRVSIAPPTLHFAD